MTESVDQTGRSINLMKINRSLYHVYVIGLVDMCCTMDGGSTIIHEQCDVEPQLRCITRSIKKYPHLLDWVETSICDWKQAVDMSLLLQGGHIYTSMESGVWYLTSPSKFSTLQSLDTYHKTGHAPLSQPPT